VSEKLPDDLEYSPTNFLTEKNPENLASRFSGLKPSHFAKLREIY